MTHHLQGALPAGDGGIQRLQKQFLRDRFAVKLAAEAGAAARRLLVEPTLRRHLAVNA